MNDQLIERGGIRVGIPSFSPGGDQLSHFTSTVCIVVGGGCCFSSAEESDRDRLPKSSENIMHYFLFVSVWYDVGEVIRRPESSSTSLIASCYIHCGCLQLPAFRLVLQLGRRRVRIGAEAVRIGTTVNAY